MLAFAIGLAADVQFTVLPKLGSWPYIGPLAKSLPEVDISWGRIYASVKVTFPHACQPSRQSYVVTGHRPSPGYPASMR